MVKDEDTTGAVAAWDDETDASSIDATQRRTRSCRRISYVQKKETRKMEKEGRGCAWTNVRRTKRKERRT